MVEMYWLTRICALNDVLVFICVMSGIITPLFVFLYFANPWEYEDNAEQLTALVKKWAKRLFYVFCISCLLVTFVPDKKDLMVIIGGGAIYDYVQNSEEVKKLPDNVVKTLNDWLAEDEEK